MKTLPVEGAFWLQRQKKRCTSIQPVFFPRRQCSHLHVMTVFPLTGCMPGRFRCIQISCTINTMLLIHSILSSMHASVHGGTTQVYILFYVPSDKILDSFVVSLEKDVAFSPRIIMRQPPILPVSHMSCHVMSCHVECDRKSRR